MFSSHWPTADRNECFRALETAYGAKKNRAIGVSNFEVSHLQELMAISEIKPMVNQVELHPGLNNTDVIKFCQENNIIIESWATLMQGQCMTNSTVLKIAEKHQKNPAQICLKWAIQQNIVVIPKSTHKERIIANTELDDFMLDDEDMTALFVFNLNSNVFWSYELNKDLQEYLINYIQNHPTFTFKQNMTTEEIIKLWLTMFIVIQIILKLTILKQLKILISYILI
ncbi:aldo/keto reductase [Spiroplasma citri]|uniref:aldo/keto reductase n=1 Tax=Spiroplasma citri TaxID=2133 RepID=UPI00241236A2|nr:aldo/keto reductase [Spiroplasma citri]